MGYKEEARRYLNYSKQLEAKIKELKAENERLQEYEWKYEELCNE